METVKSADGTVIAFDRLGDGEPLIVVGGASCDRRRTQSTAEGLAESFTVINYDRRGRGDSGDTGPYAIEREIEDLEALITAVGGTAMLYGHSSGAGLALHGAAAGLSISRLVLHEAPYVPAGSGMEAESREYAAKLDALLARGRRDDALELFFTTVGMPSEMVEAMRSDPSWASMESLAPTLAYDSAVMGDELGGTVPFERAAKVESSTLVLCGGASPPWMIDVARLLAEAVPNGQLRVLEGQEHVVPPEVLVPVLAEFATSGSPSVT